MCPYLPPCPRPAVPRLAVVMCCVAVAATGCTQGSDTAAAAVVSARGASCSWTGPAPQPGTARFTVRNHSTAPVTAVLEDPATGAIWAQSGALIPGGSRELHAVLPPGALRWRCIPVDGVDSLSAIRATTGHGDGTRPGQPLFPLTAQEADDALTPYRAAVATRLGPLATDTDHLRAAVDAGDQALARSRWQVAHQDYQRLGAAYGTFGDLAQALDGLPDGLPAGVDDPDFTGFLRVEHDLWAAVGEPRLAADTAALDDDVHRLHDRFAGMESDPADLPLRAHEILEMTAQRELSGRADQGSHTALPTARANVDGTAMVLDVLAAALHKRDPQLLADTRSGLAGLQVTLDALRAPDGSWPPSSALSTAQHERLDARLGSLLEYLAHIPDVLALPPSSGS